MRRLVCVKFGDPSLLQLVDEPTPDPGPEEVLIAVEAIGVSFWDGLVVKGGYQVKPPLPFTPGSCVVGLVSAVGARVDGARLGQRVATVMNGIGGAYSSHVVVSEDALTAVPDGISSSLAAASMESYLTIAFAITHRVTVRAADHVVVLGAGGGLGLAAIDFARSLGATVVAVASTEQKRQAAIQAGAAVALGYEDLKEQIRKASGGGADVVLDPVGGDAAESALRALASGGRYCVLGFASGQIPRFPTNVVLMRNRSVIGVDWGDWSREVGGAVGNARLLTRVLAGIADGTLKPLPPTTAPLTDAGKILSLFAERRAVGRYALCP